MSEMKKKEKNTHVPFSLDNTSHFTWPRYCSFPPTPLSTVPQPRDYSIRLTREKFPYPTMCYYIILSTFPIYFISTKNQ